ncbi:lysylphosphatidylglycerol synthase domain-containing protein [Aeromicrobium sp. IC_218]|uniref:lysylphosphatidylglycerol synthase domain-containing protein n=1 Tax=Aeromicrobium sp. IC_218 TaxID=2545468 RepID=UPI00103B5BB9|nr:lysylphosphatidylglycerol synthase domain-containing protein [Aeromicrobium sp. IC_218]TCJ00594.1 hypothetical protein E0W78_00415 [Aeromicrobium sp. IC_218]
MTEAVAPSRSRRALRRLLTLAAIALVIVLAARALLGSVDWSEVGDALGQLRPTVLVVLVVGLLVRQTLSAAPLSFFVPRLGLVRAVQNDQAAFLVSTAAPPPADLAMRLALFRSWGVAPTTGAAGTVMNTLAFYVMRFGVPVLGLLLLTTVTGYEPEATVPALGCAALSVALVVLAVVVARGSDVLVRLAARAAALARRVHRSVDADAWTEGAAGFATLLRTHLHRSFVLAVGCQLLMALVDGLLLVLALRGVGVSAAEVSTPLVLGAFLLAYPLTLLPLAGLGALDAVVAATLVAATSVELEPSVLAGLAAWRGVTLLVPLALGVGAVVHWRLAGNDDGRPPPQG